MLEIRQLVEEVGWPGTLEKDEDFIDRIVLADDGLAFFCYRMTLSCFGRTIPKWLMRPT